MPDMPKAPSKIPILQLLAGLRGGAVVQEVQEELERIANAVRLVEKKGTLTISFTLRPAGQVPGALFFETEISSKVPKPKRGSDMFFADAVGGLHRSDPKQIDAFENMKPRIVGGANFDPSTGLILGENRPQA